MKMITENRSIITRATTTPGQKIHRSDRDEFLNITLQKISSFDFVNVGDPDNQNVCVNLTIGEDGHTMCYEFNRDSHTFKIENIPMYAFEEAWISCNLTNWFCVHGFVTKNPYN